MSKVLEAIYRLNENKRKQTEKRKLQNKNVKHINTNSKNYALGKNATILDYKKN